LHWRIAPDGTVVDAVLVASSLHDERAEGCMLRRLRLMRFPSSNGPSEVTYPFMFGFNPSRAP
jgi:hypothetical protein